MNQNQETTQETTRLERPDEQTRAPEQPRAPEHAVHLEVLDTLAREMLDPVWALGVQCSALRLPSDLSARERQILDVVDRSSERIARALTAVLDYVDLQARGGREVPFAPAPCEMAEIAGRALAELGEAGVLGSVEYRGEGDGTGEWDAERLVQAVGYLVETALASGPPGAPVGLRWRGDDEEVVIRVEHRPAPNDGTEARIDAEWGSVVGPGVERGIRPFIARRIVLRHGGALARFAGPEGISYVAVLPRRCTAALH